MSTESFKPTFTRTNKGTQKLLNQEASGVSLDLHWLVVSDAKFEPHTEITEIPNALDPVAFGSVESNVALKQKTFAFALPIGYGDLRINAVGLLDSEGDLIYVWSSTDPQEHLGYKELGSRYVQSVVLKILDAPFDSVNIIDDGSLSNIDLSFADVEWRQMISLAHTHIAIGEMAAQSRTLQEQQTQLKRDLINQIEHHADLLSSAVMESGVRHVTSLAHEMIAIGELSLQTQSQLLEQRVQHARIAELEHWKVEVTQLLSTQLNFNARVHNSIGTLAQQ